MISPSTICYALKMTHDFLRGKYLLERTEYNRKCLEEFSDAVDEIDDGKFEIEGYERVEWTRFNPKDESTYPPKGKFLAYGGFECEPQGIFFGLSYDNKSTRIAYGKVLKYWRPLPKPPQETEEGK